MNVKQITRALHTLSLLSEEDYDLVLKLRALTEDEREQFRTALELQKPAGKKTSKKASKSSSKSPRATGIEQQLNKRREQGREVVTTKDDDYDGGLCLAGIDSKGETCGEPVDHNVHHLNSHPDYHPFVPDVRAVPTPSPANGGVESGTVNSEIAKDAASTVAHGAGGGD